MQRQNHIESEKRRRETIKAAFGALVETLRSANALGDDDQAQGRPRGRGRKGEVRIKDELLVLVLF